MIIYLYHCSFRHLKTSRGNISQKNPMQLLSSFILWSNLKFSLPFYLVGNSFIFLFFQRKHASNFTALKTVVLQKKDNWMFYLDNFVRRKIIYLSKSIALVSYSFHLRENPVNLLRKGLYRPVLQKLQTKKSCRR